MSLDRAKFRNKLKEALGGYELGERVDLMVYLSHVLFLEKLAKKMETEVRNKTKSGKTPLVREKDVIHVDTVLEQLRE